VATLKRLILYSNVLLNNLPNTYGVITAPF
jgi:hypothetical protein